MNDNPPHIAVIRYRTRGWPHPWRDHYEERAAIMEFDGGLSREEAETQAYLIVSQMKTQARMAP